MRVPAANIIGGVPGVGFKTAMKVLDRGRLHISALACGMAHRLITDAVAYAIFNLVACGIGVALTSNYPQVAAMKGVTYLPVSDLPKELHTDTCLAWSPLANMNDLRWYGANATLPASSQTSRSGRSTSSRTSRQKGHSPCLITKRAAPPISSATRCGSCGRS